MWSLVTGLDFVESEQERKLATGANNRYDSWCQRSAITRKNHSIAKPQEDSRGPRDRIERRNDPVQTFNWNRTVSPFSSELPVESVSVESNVSRTTTVSERRR